MSFFCMGLRELVAQKIEKMAGLLWAGIIRLLIPCGSVCADHGIGTGEAVGAGRDSHPNRHQREQLQRFGVEAVEMQPLPAYEKLKSAEPVYLTFDMDVLDPAFAPGVWHREPGECWCQRRSRIYMRLR